MKIKTQKLKVSKSEADKINKLLNINPKSEKECFGEDEKISYTVIFDDNTEMDIQICGVQYEENSINTAWSQAVLYRNGCEIACSDAEDSFLGNWELETYDCVYCVNVTV